LEIIDSPYNQYVKRFRVLQTVKGRREQGVFLAEGGRLIGEALDAGWPILAAAVCTDLLGPGAKAIAERLRSGDWPCYEMSPRAFSALSAEKTPSGVAIAAICATREMAELRPGPSHLVVAAWELRDPGNLGTLVRTAEFLGALALVAVGDCVDFFDPKTVRATAGAIFRLPLAKVSPEGFWRWTESEKVSVLAGVSDGGVTPESLDLCGPVTFLVGSEAHGLPLEAEQRAQGLVTIPRRGKVESLNAAIAAGICLYEITRQLDKQHT